MCSVHTKILACLALLALGAPGRGAGQEDPFRLRSTDDDRRIVTVTVYNQNFGLVREVRDVPLSAGRVALEFADVAARIQPETVHIADLGGGRLQVLEQNYQYDLLNPQKLLEKYLGRTVYVYRFNPETEREERVEAEVLSTNGGTILRIGDEITYNYPGRFAFPEIPANLIAKPTLLWLLDSDGGSRRLEVSYLTRQLNWKSDYVLVVGQDDSSGDLTGWVTLTNQSGVSYEGARLKLVAGDVQRVSDRDRARMMQDAMRAAAAEASAFSEESFFEYHLYTLDRPTTLGQNEQKQVLLLEGRDIAVDKQLVFYGAAQYYRGSYGQVVSNQKVGVYLDLVNSEEHGLGMPLPRGIVRVYKADATGAQQFIGEDRIDHTPRDERVRIKMGEAFDVVGDRRQMEYRVLGSCVSESSWRVSLRNHKEEAAEVRAMEPVGGDWEIVSTSHRVERLDAHTFAFDVTVPARDEVVIEYRVRVRWC